MILRQLLHHASSRPESPALQALYGDSKLGLTYADYGAAVVGVAEFLKNLGVQKGERVLIWSTNRPEWVIADLAALSLGALPCGVPSTASETFADEYCNLVRPAAAFCSSDKEGLLRTLGIPSVVPFDSKVFSHLIHGKTFGADVGRYLEDAIQKSVLTDVAYLTPTSGTTGGVKACSITHANIEVFCKTFSQIIGLTHEDRNFSVVPLSQQKLNDHYLFLYCGGLICFADFTRDVIAQLSLAKPTMIAVPPFLFEDLRKLQLSPAANEASSLSSLLGGARHLYTGGAAVSTDLLEFYAAQGHPIHEAYGMTECCSMATVNTRSASKIGSAGRPLQNTQVSIALDGEILISGPGVFAGYWRNEKDTKEVFQGEWLHTGDLGRFDADGYLHILGRKKDLIILETGRNIFPFQIEERFSAEPGVGRAIMLGNGRRRPCMLVTVEGTAHTDADFARRLDSALVEVNRQRNADECLLGWFAASEELSVEAGDLTSTLKVRRSRLEEKYKPQLDGLYAGQWRRRATQTLSG